MIRKLLTTLVTGLIPYCLWSQVTVPVYTEFNKGDSVETAFKLISGELQKSAAFTFQLQSPTAFAGRGILLLKTNKAQQYRIDFPDKLKTYGPEGIYIKGTNQSVTIIANTGLGLREAVYKYLEQTGFRYFMPGDIWKVVPSLQSPYKNYTVLIRPDYEYREIANGHGYGNSEKLAKDFNSWAEYNQMGGAFRVATGHAYESIVQDHADLFKAHPEYFAKPVKAGTLPDEFKFNVANRDLVNFLAQDAVKRFEANVKSGYSSCMVSMEPSDGGGYGDLPELKPFGGPSDQVFYLTNYVARELRRKYPEAWVGGYAYNNHMLPPRFKLEPNVFVEITNGFNRTQYTTVDLLKLWKAKATKTGIYDYLGVFEWTYDMPGQVPAAKPAIMKKALKEYYDNGARVFQGESTMGWVNRGPGQYILSKLFWNLNANTDSLLEDFYNTAFGPAAPHIKKLYSTWEKYTLKVPLANDLADWITLVNNATAVTRVPAIQARIDAIKKYLIYLVWYTELKQAPTMDNLMRIMRYAYRSYDDAQFATLPILASLPFYSGHPGIGWYDKDQPWRADKRPYTNSDLQDDYNKIQQTVKKSAGVIYYSADAPYVPLQDVYKIPAKQYNTTPHSSWYNTEYIFQIGKKQADNYFEIKSDFITPPPNERPVKITVFQAKATQSGQDEMPVTVFYQSVKNKIERLSLASLAPGDYRLKVEDQGKMFSLSFSPTVNHSMIASMEKGVTLTSLLSLNTFYFYVPPGVTVFQIAKSNGFMLQSPSGRVINKTTITEETFAVNVQGGESGIWTISNQGGFLALNGIPPFLGDHPSTMLVPAYLKK